MRISDWSSDVCSSDLPAAILVRRRKLQMRHRRAGKRMQEMQRGKSRKKHPEAGRQLEGDHGKTCGQQRRVDEITQMRIAPAGRIPAVDKPARQDEPRDTGRRDAHLRYFVYATDRKSTRLNSSH